MCSNYLLCVRFLHLRLARDFGVSEDMVRGWHCLVLLRRGHDVLGEEALSQVSQFDSRFLLIVCSRTGVVGRSRLSSSDAEGNVLHIGMTKLCFFF